MLQAIRDRVSGILAIIVLGLLAIPFLFVGVQGYFQSSGEQIVATAGDIEITSSEFQTEYNRYRQSMREQFGERFDEFAADDPVARRQYLESLVERRLLQSFAMSNGMDVPPGQLAERIRSIEAFHVAGQFDAEAYRRLLAIQNITPQELESDLRQGMVADWFLSAVGDSAQPTPAEVDALLRLQNETREVSFAVVDKERFVDEVQVTESDVQAYYEDNSQQFRRPERVTLEYLQVDAGNFRDQVAIQESELRARYEANQQRYKTPERRKASHILIEVPDDASEEQEREARELAQSLAERARADEDFAKLAAQYSDDEGNADQGGDLGWIEPGVMVQAFEDALYGLDQGEVSDPVRTGFGFHVIKLREIEPSEGQSFEQARAELRQEIVETEAERLYLDVADRLVDLSFEHPDSLQPAAEELGLELKRTDPFTRDGASEGIASNPEVVEIAFSDLVLEQRSNSDPIYLDDNRLLIIRVAEHQPAQPRPLEEVSEEIRSVLTQQRASQLARESAQSIVEAARAGESSLQGAAEARGLQLVSQSAIGRQAFQHGQQFIDELFSLPAPADGPDWHVTPYKQGGAAALRLDRVVPGNAAEASEAERQRAAQRLARGFANTTREAFIAHLRSRTDIKIYPDRI